VCTHAHIKKYVWFVCEGDIRGIFFGTDHRLARDLNWCWSEKSNNGQTCCWKRRVGICQPWWWCIFLCQGPRQRKTTFT